jgi:transposase
MLVAKAAAAAEVSDRTCSKWVVRYRATGQAGLHDRSSAPHRVANRTYEQTVQLLAALRRLRFTAPELADLPCSTISGVLKRTAWASSAASARSLRSVMSASGRAS